MRISTLLQHKTLHFSRIADDELCRIFRKYLLMVSQCTTDTSNLFINFSEECSLLVVSNAYNDFKFFKSSKLPSRSAFSL